MTVRWTVQLALMAAVTCGAAAATNTSPVWIHSVATGAQSLESWHDYWSDDISRRVEYFDRFFGDERLSEDNRKTRFSLRLGVKYDRRDEVEVTQRIDARLALPQLQNRLQVIFDDAVDVEDSPYMENFRQSVRDAKQDAGLRYILHEDEQFRFTSDAGVRLGGSPQVFGRTRGRYTVPFNIWELRLSERLQWYSEDGFGALSEMAWSRKIGTGGLLRVRSTLDWREEQRGVEPGQSVTFFHAISDHASFNTVLRANWPETPHGGLAVYGLETTYRRLIHSDWVFLEVTPGLEYLEEEDFGWNPLIKIGFEIQFQREPAAKPGS